MESNAIPKEQLKLFFDRTRVQALISIDEHVLGGSVGTLDASSGAEHFNTLVVAERTTSGVLDHAESAVLQQNKVAEEEEEEDEEKVSFAFAICRSASTTPLRTVWSSCQASIAGILGLTTNSSLKQVFLEVLHSTSPSKITGLPTLNLRCVLAVSKSSASLASGSKAVAVTYTSSISSPTCQVDSGTQCTVVRQHHDSAVVDDTAPAITSASPTLL